MTASKGLSALALAFTMVTGACATAGNQVKTAPDRALSRLDFACSDKPINYMNEAEDCLQAAIEAEEAFDAKLAPLAGEGANVDYELLGALYRANESQYCTDARSALQIWINDLAGARRNMFGYVRHDAPLHGSMVRYFETSAKCYEDWQRAAMEAKQPALEADARNRVNLARSTATAIANRFQR